MDQVMEFVERHGLNNLWVYDWVVVVSSIFLVFAGVAATWFWRWYLKPLGLLGFCLGVGSIVWLGSAQQCDWVTSEPMEAPMIEQYGQQLLLVPRSPGSTDLEVINLNRTYGRKFPDKAVFTVRYKDYSATYRGIRFTLQQERMCNFFLDLPKESERSQ